MFQLLINQNRILPALNARVFNPDFIGTDTEMYRDLALSTEMSSLGMDLALPMECNDKQLLKASPTYLFYWLVYLLVSTTDDIKQVIIFNV